MSQGCVSPDGKPTERAIELLKLLLEKGKLSDLEIAEMLKRPLFQVRSSLRELSKAGFVEKKEDFYFITEKGKDVL
jgi:predicted transcriptional regulator